MYRIWDKKEKVMVYPDTYEHCDWILDALEVLMHNSSDEWTERIELMKDTGFVLNGRKIYQGDIFKQEYYYPYEHNDPKPEYAYCHVKWVQENGGWYLVWSNIFVNKQTHHHEFIKRGDNEECRDQLNVRWIEAKIYPLIYCGNIYENGPLQA